MDFGGHKKPINNGGDPYGSSHVVQQRRQLERAAYIEKKTMFGNFEEDRPKDQDYRGFHIFQINTNFLHWGIRTLDGSTLPRRLEGVWTHLDKAMREIDVQVETQHKEIA